MKLGAKNDMRFQAGLVTGVSAGLFVHPKTRYHVECWRRGKFHWQEDFDNIVVTAGLDKLIDATFKTGLTTPLWYVGLKASGSIVPGDTMGGHGGWSELTSYSGARPGFTPGSIVSGSVDNSAAKATFNITDTMTIYGCFLSDDDTVGGIVGTLYGGGDFSLARAVILDDIIYASLTLSVS